MWAKGFRCRRHVGRFECGMNMQQEEGEMWQGLSQGVDCLPVSLLLLHSSSQAQVCVGSDWVLSDDSNSCCVPALPHTHTQVYMLMFTVSDLPQAHRIFHYSCLVSCIPCICKLSSHIYSDSAHRQVCTLYSPRFLVVCEST